LAKSPDNKKLSGFFRVRKQDPDERKSKNTNPLSQNANATKQDPDKRKSKNKHKTPSQNASATSSQDPLEEDIDFERQYRS
jgi:hypothetical protein